MRKTPDLTIVIVSFNTKDLLDQCLQSVFEAQDKLSLELIVVDNASVDGSQELVERKYSKAQLVRLSKNLGFAAANNIAFNQTSGRYVLLLNPDTRIEKNTLKMMLKFMDEHLNVGVATCKVNLPDGSLDEACHRGFPTPWASFTYFIGLEKLIPNNKITGQYHLTYFPLDTIHEIDSPAGAFYLIRKLVLDRVGGFDERFFMYAEELDLSLRIKEAGWKIMYVPTTTIIHYKGRAGRRSDNEDARVKATRAFYKTMQQFYDKHYSNKYPWIINQLVRITINVLLLVQ